MQVTDLMRRIVYEAAIEKDRAASKVQNDNRWSFNKNYKLVVNPEVRCPNCLRWFPTYKVWLVNEKRGYLAGIWDYETGEQGSLYAAHPHVFSGGRICIGAAKDFTTALTTGLCFTDYANSDCTPGMLLRSLGDTCEEVMREKCYECGNSGKNHIDRMHRDSSGHWFCKYCEEGKEEIEQCLNCDNPAEDDSSYCGDCCCEECVAKRNSEENEEEEEEDE